ncbi:MAG: LysM domain-containing protein [Actinomycetota bacterium]
MRRPIPPAVAHRRRPTRRSGRALASGAVLVLAAGLAGCGRSAPVDALGQTEGDPDIAGVTVTSPDAVIDGTTTPTGADTTTTVVAPAQPQQVLYTVQPGDTLSVIAGNFGVPIDELAAYNGITDVNSITPGDELAIPPAPSGPTEPAPSDEGQGG